MTINVVFLTYDIMFNDSDNGSCYAGDGQRILKVFLCPDKAREFVESLRKVVTMASSENIVFPKQPGNRQMHKLLGFDLHDLPGNNSNYMLVVESLDIE